MVNKAEHPGSSEKYAGCQCHGGKEQSKRKPESLLFSSLLLLEQMTKTMIMIIKKIQLNALEK
jgi:hypothetical protein